MIILNFHGVGPASRKIDDDERDCWLDRDAFEGVLDLLRGLSHVRLTVDDGNASDFEIILSALLRRDLRATFFVCSGRLDEPGFLARAQVRELLAQGMGIGSHGAAHVSWRKLSHAQLKAELEGSRRVLEEVCCMVIDTAACPFGAYDRRVLTGLRRAGYRTVYTSDDGPSQTHQWLQARTTITRSMSMHHVNGLIWQKPSLMGMAVSEIRKLVKRLRT